MRNKRLLAILIVFIVVITAALLGSVVFTVKEIKVQFANRVSALAGREEEVKQDVQKALPFVLGNNIFLSVNEERIQKAVHADPKLILVKVTNIEAIFPNILQVTVRERYPVYCYESGTGTAVLDGDLRIVGNSNPSPSVINIANQIETVPFEDHYLKIGNYLTDYLPRDADGNADTTRTGILKSIVPFYRFSNIQTNEDAVCAYFDAFKFVRLPCDATGESELNLLMRQPAQGDGQNNYRLIRIECADYRFLDKLQMAWDGVESVGQEKPGQHWVFDDDIADQGINWRYNSATDGIDELWNQEQTA